MPRGFLVTTSLLIGFSTRPRARMYPQPHQETASRPPMARTSPVSMEIRDGVALISMSNPPVNALAIPGARRAETLPRISPFFVPADNSG